VDELAAAWAEERALWNVPDLAGLPVAVGFLSYELGRCFERIRGRELPSSPWPLLEFRFYDSLIACHEATGQGEIWARDGRAARRIARELLQPPEDRAEETEPWSFDSPEKEPWEGSFNSRGERRRAKPVDARASLVELEAPSLHLAAVARALDYIRAGDIYQVNLARRLGCAIVTRSEEAPGYSLFLRLESAAPAPHACWMADGENGTALVGNSPERFLRRTIDGLVETSPIKGTRPRDAAGPSERNAELLLSSAKDRAEHVMIVDLERNDLGRVCETGSVEVADLCRLLALPTVFHLESTVRGRLRPDVGLAGLVAATFPGGSVTGAPKIRAMEIIEELEPARRGPYTGATGWLGAAGDLDLAVAIRTALIRDGRLTLWVGGGIVADSTPEAELAETWDKARAFSRALK
jgi:para-aminobenzoate synthetase component 1